ncbi:MAG: response regulator [Halothiobacillaceae bacterium]|nr:response regulator [Halothiobacillaceae bacterium]
MKTILVVDDSKTARLTLKRKLEALQNVQVEMADSGEAAIELLQHNTPPDLIFMDVLMGNMSGYEAAATILKNPVMADVPIVMCTSKDAQEDRDEAAKNGAKGFIIKPISDEALAEVWRDLVLNRVHAAPVVAPAPEPVSLAVPAPQITAPNITEAAEAMPQIVITAELEALVRQMVEQSNLQRAEEAAGQVVHAALGEHLHQVEDILEGKISILTSSLAALHSAQEKAQAEYQSALTSLSNTGKPVDDEHISNLIMQQLTDFEAQEHSKRAIHELDLQTKLEQSLPSIAEQVAHSTSERMIQQALGSHFAMMDEKLNAIQVEFTALKSAPKVEAAPAVFDEQALFAQLESQLERRLNDSLPSLVAAQADAHLKAHIQASDEKFQSIKHELSAGIQAVSDALLEQQTQPTPAPTPAVLPQEFPHLWMQQLLAKQDEMLEHRFDEWSAQMDAQLTQSERAIFERMDEKMNELSQQAKVAQLAAEKARQQAMPQQKQDTSSSKLALGVAAVGVVLALIAMFI